MPAGDVVRLAAAHGLVLHDDVLDGLIHGVADVDLAIRVGRAVVEHEFRRAVPLRETLVIQVHVLPEFDEFRFFLRKIAPHGEIGLRQMQSLAVIHLFLLKKNPAPRKGREKVPVVPPS